MSENAFDVLCARGFVQQTTDAEAIRALFGAGKPVVVYCGYDPTADSLHVGHLFTLMGLMHLERLGHKPIALLGGATAMVGDPSGKTEMRPVLAAEHIAANRARLEAQIGRFLDLAGGKSLCVDNALWLLSLGYIDFLRDIGRCFSVNRMLAAEAYKLRLERGLSFIEFNYQLLQAYDFLELHRRHRCVLQMGGDDQWGNILAGVDLVRRIESVTVHGLTFPLQLTATGEKMGKTAAGAVWLDPEKLSPYDYYQYFVNTHDADVGRMLGFFTFLPMPEIEAATRATGVAINLAKSILAFEATLLAHGQEAALAAHAAAQAAFGERTIPPDLMPSSTVPRAATVDLSSLPKVELTCEERELGITATALVVRAGLAASNRQARNQLAQGQFKLDGETIDAEYASAKMPPSWFLRPRLLQLGKKKVLV